MKTKEIRPHVENCSALLQIEMGRWTNPWWFPGKTVRRDRAGRNHPHGSQEWLVIECNSVNCDACVLVRVEDILDAI